MIIGVPKEVKSDEYRVGMLAVGAHLLVEDGHEVLIEKDAGSASGFEDAAYIEAGARIVDTAEEIYARSEMVVNRELQMGLVFLTNSEPGDMGDLVFDFLDLYQEHYPIRQLATSDQVSFQPANVPATE